MKLAIITGSGSYELAGLRRHETIDVDTRFGTARVRTGTLGDVEVLHLSRHGDGHARLSSQVNHRANILALRELGAQAVIGLTVCGAVDPSIELGSLIVFDDLHFLINRLPDGSLCTLHDEPGRPGRGHWVFDGPFCEPLRVALLVACARAGVVARDGGCYGHVDGPRLNSRTEIRMLAACGVSAVSQTGGPEVVLCGEAELPYALLGYATDHANGVHQQTTSVSELVRLIGESSATFASVLDAALPLLAGMQLQAPGSHVRWQ